MPAITQPRYRSGSKKSTDISVGILNGKPSIQVNWGGRIYGVPLSLAGSGNTLVDSNFSNIRVGGNALFDSGATTLKVTGDGISIKDSNSGKILKLINNADNVFIGNPDVGSEITFDSTYSVENIAIGTDAMKNSEYGRWNVFLGYQAGENFGDDCSQTASVFGNVAIGRRAYRCVSASNVIGVYNVAIGFGAMEDAVAGNGSTCVGYRAGEGLEAGYNTLIGYNAGYNSGSGNITTGTNNICISGGDDTSNSTALTNANDDTFAISIGAYCKAGDFAIAMGKTAIASGEDSIALGIDTDATGAQSIAVGDGAQATAAQSIAIGDGADSSEAQSIAIGEDTDATGAQSIAIGEGALATAAAAISIGDGSNVSVADGIAIGRANTVDDANAIAIGYSNLIQGDHTKSILIGDDNATAGEHSILLGSALSTGTSDNLILIGENESSSGNWIYANYTTSTTFSDGSDRRLKKNIIEGGIGLDFINDLKPCTFDFKAPNEMDNDFDGYDENNDNPKTDKKQYGLIAQEVKESIDKYNASEYFHMWSLMPNTNIQSISRGKLVMPLLKAIQELSAKLDNIDERLTNLETV